MYPAWVHVRGTGLLYGLEVNGSGGHTPRQCAKRIINLLASEARVLIGYEGPEASVLKLRPPMPFAPSTPIDSWRGIEAAARSPAALADELLELRHDLE